MKYLCTLWVVYWFLFWFVQIDSYVKIFPNVSHGWTVRYDPNDPKAVKAAGKAHKIMINWFDKHLKKFWEMLSCDVSFVSLCLVGGWRRGASHSTLCLYQDRCKSVTDLTIKIFYRTQFLNALFKVISKYIKGVVYCFRSN